jgi:hypothetical protein
MPALPLPLTVTVTDRAALPPGPVQVSEKVVFTDRGAVVSPPDVALVPLQPPLASHAVASEVDQASCAVPPLVMLVGVAENVTVGAPLDGGGLEGGAVVLVSFPPPPQPPARTLTSAAASQ